MKLNLSEAMTKIKTILSGHEIKLEALLLEDGVTTIEADVFESGNSVFIVTESENIPLPIGNYKLEDGRVLIVEEEGTISSIETPEAEEEVEEVIPDPNQDVINNAKIALQKAFGTIETELEEVITEEEEVIVAPTEEVVEEVVLTENVLQTQFDELALSITKFESVIETKNSEIEALKLEISKIAPVKKIVHSPIEQQKLNINQNQKLSKFAKIINHINK